LTNFSSEWDRFAKTEYERLAMEEEQGEDSEVLDAMDGWDSEEETAGINGTAAASAGAVDNTVNIDGDVIKATDKKEEDKKE
jgi:hypothetical protein